MAEYGLDDMEADPLIFFLPYEVFFPHPANDFATNTFAVFESVFLQSVPSSIIPL
jgi:hypothetical protein